MALSPLLPVLTLQMTMTSSLIGQLMALPLIPKELLPPNLTDC